MSVNMNMSNCYLDLDECATDNGGCEDICVNTVSSYRCRCKKKGYVLSDDRHHCSGMYKPRKIDNKCFNWNR